MEEQMPGHTGADAIKQMREQMRISYEEMGGHTASHQNSSIMDGQIMSGGLSGIGCH